ncbi:MAG: amidophosphoribosyltransferase [Opitutales bacterium]
MSDFIGHECGVALIRLRKPLSHFAQKYGSALHGFNQLFLLMEKQHNRGQDGAGIGAVKLSVPAGRAYAFRDREVKANALQTIFNRQLKAFRKLTEAGRLDADDPASIKRYWDFGAEVYLGHLRYGTSGSYLRSATQPYLRKSAWPTRSLMLAGNFNLTNTGELNLEHVRRGAHPIYDTDTQTILEEIGFHLDEEHQRLYHEFRDEINGMPSEAIAPLISQRLDLGDVLRRASHNWDGGYTMAGVVGNGDCFVLRDPGGIRPAFYYEDDEIAAFASERVPLMTVFGLEAEAIQQVPPGEAVLIKHSGKLTRERIREPGPPAACTFERIYFSRGNDPDIYRERKALGAALGPPVLQAIDNDLQHAVFSFVPNTAEIAYHGLMDALREHRRLEVKAAVLDAARSGHIREDLLDALLDRGWPRGEKIAHKDIKLRTFISQEHDRLQLASHVYDVTYGVVAPEDHLVVIDDSIVRGTTLRQSIVRILARTNPRSLVIASTAPQIRYPDCYGIDMSELGKFIAFQAAVELVREAGQESLLDEIYRECAANLKANGPVRTNPVKRLYAAFSEDVVAERIATLVRPDDLAWSGQLRVLYQSIQSLHQACPKHRGDWYFTGDYPTPGGLRVVNQAFINFYEHREGRSY